MKLGIQVGLGPVHIVLSEDSAPRQTNVFTVTDGAIYLSSMVYRLMLTTALAIYTA